MSNMKTSSIPKKFLSRRDKSGRGRSSDGAQRTRPISSDGFFSIFNMGKHAKNSDDKAQEEEKQKAKIEDVRQKCDGFSIDLRGLQDEHILFALNSKYASMDVDKAVEMLVLQQAALSGEIIKYNPNVHMLGAENKGNVTCYLDALLFAMFAKLDAFECMLKVDIRNDEPRKRLAVLLRLWVNMLRSGKLIDIDMTENIQCALADCGWREARYPEQQDTSEAFAFITEKLQLPLLTLQVDLFHHGKNDDADHKVVYERLLNLAVPPDSEGKGVKLEDCLEEYFNSRVDVHREGSDEKKLCDSPETSSSHDTPTASVTPKATIRLVLPEDNEIPNSSTQEPLDAQSQDTEYVAPQTPRPEVQTVVDSPSSLRRYRSRAESIIQRVVIDSKEPASDTDTNSTGFLNGARQKLSVVRAVTIPAWQFFKLIPWHSPSTEEPQSDLEVAKHFSQRPVVGICLKRYMMDNYGNMRRQNTYIDIPDSLRLPHFIIDDRHVEEGGLAADYKLVLQSVVCHRGDSLHSGHYISFSRVAPKLLTDNRRHDSDPPPDYEEAQWVKFDDLALERVVTVDDIKESLKEEMPYLLFYQIIPMVNVAPSSADSMEVDPPAYDGAPVAFTSDNHVHQESQMVSRRTSSFFDGSSGIPSAAQSVRFSVDIERPVRPSFADDDGHLGVSRRTSLSYGEMKGLNGSAAPADHSLPVGAGEETTAQRLSRAAARFKSSSKSRPPSQAGENRIAQTMSKFGLMKTSKESAPRDSNPELQVDESGVPLNGNGDAQERRGRKGKEKEKEKDKEKEKESGHHKRVKSKQRGDKSGKSKDKEVPDRECVVQ